MKARLLVSAIGIPLLLGIVFCTPPWCMTVCLAVLSMIAAYELLHAVGGGQWKHAALAIVLAGGNTLCFSGAWLSSADAGVPLFLTVVLCFALAVAGYGTKRAISYPALMAMLFAAAAIPASFSCLARLRCTSPLLALTPFVAAFCSDSLALFAGMLFGKHKLAPHTSPKKTVEGSIGGVLGAVLGMVLLRLLTSLKLDWSVVLALGVLGSVMGQLGDLSFSFIKREFSVKDYGNLMPGHGGVLDRFDSVLFVAPAFWLYLSIVF